MTKRTGEFSPVIFPVELLPYLGQGLRDLKDIIAWYSTCHLLREEWDDSTRAIALLKKALLAAQRQHWKFPRLASEFEPTIYLHMALDVRFMMASLGRNASFPRQFHDAFLTGPPNAAYGAGELDKSPPLTVQSLLGVTSNVDTEVDNHTRWLMEYLARYVRCVTGWYLLYRHSRFDAWKWANLDSAATTGCLSKTTELYFSLRPVKRS
jgi:hypothetical protein